MIRTSATYAARMALVIGAVAALTAPVGTVERKPLPAFVLTALDGSAVQSADLARTGPWLLLYVRAGCAPCDTLFQAIDPRTTPALPSRTVVVIGGVDAAGAGALAARFKDLKGIAWYADPAGAMNGPLPIAGAPVVFGMRGSMVEWSLAGVVPDAASMRSALVSWAGR